MINSSLENSNNYLVDHIIDLGAQKLLLESAKSDSHIDSHLEQIANSIFNQNGMQNCGKTRENLKKLEIKNLLKSNILNQNNMVHNS